MRLIIGLFIALLATSLVITSACAPVPIFTEGEVETLIWHWEQDQLLAINKSDHSKAAELRDRMCWQEEARYWSNGDRFNIDNPLITADYSFKPNNVWLVTVTTTWQIPQDHRETARVAYDWISEKNNLKSGKIYRKCLYRVNDETGEVNPAGIE